MKCWHLVAALAIAGCGLNTSSLPSTGRSGQDAGVSATEASSSIAGSPASWPARRRPSRLAQDGGSSDTNDASKPVPGGPTTNDKDAQTDPAQGGPANPSGSPSPSGQPASGGPSKPGSQAQPPGGSTGNGNNGSNGNGNGQNGSSPNRGAEDAGVPDASSSGAHDPDDDGSSDEDEHSDDGDQSGHGDHGDHGDNGEHGNSSGNGDNGDNSGPGSGSNDHGGPSQSDDAVSIIVDLVIAILDLSLGPVRPSEIETLVSSILVLSLAPAELAAESLVAVLDALDDTQICLDHPERCNPLCTNLESDCSACGRDEDCIERIEEMCKVKLPKTCL
jgi:hypothetical protein